jgi:hypothetical protein
MSRGLAESGIEKWTVDTNRMTVTFYDKAGNEILIEASSASQSCWPIGHILRSQSVIALTDHTSSTSTYI